MIVGPIGAQAPVAKPREPDAWQAAQAFEAQFLAQMLKHTGLGQTHGAHGTETSQFTSLLNEQQAERMVEAGGIGLAEKVYPALVKGFS